MVAEMSNSGSDRDEDREPDYAVLKPNEFVDRLAAALARTNFEGAWDRLRSPTKALYRADIRRVLMAAMEPTRKMREAGQRAWEAKPSLATSACYLTWQAMMQEALRDE
jgi:hypothetical protein